MTRESARPRSEKKASAGTSILEWVFAALGAVLLVAALAYLIQDGLTQSSGAPDLNPSAISVARESDGYLVRIRVENRGDSTAAQVVVAGERREQGRVLETSETIIDYVPRGSAREAGLVFQGDPADSEFSLSVRAYTDP